jgi:hypothetical protein
MSLNTSKIAISSTLAIFLLGTVFVSRAAAGCGRDGRPSAGGLLPQSWQGPAEISPSLLLVANHKDGDDRIVGFWKVKFVSEGSATVPDGTVIDDGYAQWHSDGTEVTNSLFAPATGSVCYGVWRKSGPSSYTLNHFGLAWNLDGTFIGPAQVREEVVLDRSGNRFEGTFTIDQYDPSGTLLDHFAGRVTARRITVNTPIQKVL